MVDDDFQALQSRRKELQEGRQDSNRVATTRLAVNFLDLSGPHVRARDALIRLAGAGWDLNYTKLRRFSTKHWTSITQSLSGENCQSFPFFCLWALFSRTKTSNKASHINTRPTPADTMGCSAQTGSAGARFLDFL